MKRASLKEKARSEISLDGVLPADGGNGTAGLAAFVVLKYKMCSVE